MSTAHIKPPDRTLLGIAFMCLANTIFPVMNGLVQVLSTRYPSEQLVWARTAGHLVFVLLLFAPRFGMGLLRTTGIHWQLARSVVLIVSTFLYFIGVKYLPLAEATSIGFTAPFIVALLAWPMLGERVGIRRMIAISIGFVGVLIVIRPGTDFNWASVLVFGSAAFYALYQIITRRVAGHDRPETSVVYSALVGTIIMSFIAPFVWVTPASLTDAVLMFSLGILGGLSHYCIARALLYGQANIIAPFSYWQMVGAVIVGYLISGLLPGVYTWVGTAIIIGAGLYIGWRERRILQRTAAPMPPRPEGG